MHWPPLPSGDVLGNHFHQGLNRPQERDMVRRNMSLKNPVTPLGISAGTIQLVVQRLNHYTTPGPITIICTNKYNHCHL